jgi:cell division protein FtsQ
MRRVKKEQKRAADARRQAVRRAPRRLPRAWIAGSAGAVCVGLVAATWMLWPTEWIAAQEQALIDQTMQASASMGLTVERVMVEGRHDTPPELLISTIEVTAGDPILAIDPEAIRLRLEDLPWIRSATVERRLPGEIRLTIVEREPIAIWQRDGRYHLIDRYGDALPITETGKYTGMLVLTGEDAPAQAQALLDLLALEPELATRVVAAQRVGARRWNLQFDNGVDVRLPEEEPAAAWRALAAMEREQGLIDRDLVTIDMRVPDRLIVRLSPAAAELRRTPGDDT